MSDFLLSINVFILFYRLRFLPYDSFHFFFFLWMLRLCFVVNTSPKTKVLGNWNISLQRKILNPYVILLLIYGSKCDTTPPQIKRSYEPKNVILRNDVENKMDSTWKQQKVLRTMDIESRNKRELKIWGRTAWNTLGNIEGK